MAEETLQAIEDWCFSLRGQDVEEALTAMGLNRQGRSFERLARLQRWLLGEYTAADFEPSNIQDEREERRHRFEARRMFIEQTIHERTGSTLFDENVQQDAPHPLQRLECDPEVTRAIELAQPHTPDLSNERVDEAAGARAVTPEEQRGDARTQSEQVISDRSGQDRNPQRVESLTTTDGTQFQVPGEFLQLFMDMRTQMAELSQRVTELWNASHVGEVTQHPPVSSTRWDARSGLRPSAAEFQMPSQQRRETGPRVRLQDTYTYYPHNSSPVHLEQSQDSSRVEPPVTRIGRAWGRGNLPGSNTPGISDGGQGTMDISLQRNPRDVGQIVRRWEIRFSGEQNQSIELFITRVEESRRLANLSEEEVLLSL